jgi:hypothetical protein
MSDTPLLRLARLTLRLAGDVTGSDADSLNLHAALFDLVRDLEAAQQPERRTITRKQYEMAVGRISSSRDELSASVCALICLREWDLTVEDA